MDSDVSNRVWYNAEKDGKHDPNHSERILVRWLSKWENYNQYWSGNEGLTKVKLCDAVLLSLLKSNGVRIDCTAKKIYDKITWFEAKFKDGLMWRNQTGI